MLLNYICENWHPIHQRRSLFDCAFIFAMKSKRNSQSHFQDSRNAIYLWAICERKTIQRILWFSWKYLFEKEWKNYSWNLFYRDVYTNTSSLSRHFVCHDILSVCFNENSSAVDIERMSTFTSKRETSMRKTRIVRIAAQQLHCFQIKSHSSAPNRPRTV